MQARRRTEALPIEGRVYSAPRPRTLTRIRPRQSARVAELRKRANGSPAALARRVGESQRNTPFWAQRDKPPRADVPPNLTRVLGVSVERILDLKTQIERRAGPLGNVRKLVEDVSALPRRHQDKAVAFVSALIARYRRQASAGS